MKLQTTELLRRFVALTPKEWRSGPAIISDTVIELALPCGGDEDGIAFFNSGRIDLTDDRESAEAIIFLWDWLKGRSLEVTLLQSYGDGEWICLCQHPFAQTMRHRTAAREEGNTRIESLVRACVAVLEAKAVTA